jgi:DNA polymerase-3 subunit beta
MKAIVLQTDLVQGLNLVSRYVSNKGQLPILSNILFSFNSEGLFLSATNLSVSAKTYVGGKTKSIGQTTVSAKTILEFVNSLPSSQVEIEGEEGKMKISCDKYKASFPAQPAQDFPVLTDSPLLEEKKVKIETSWLFEAASQVGFAASVDDSRPVLTGIKIEHQDKKLIMTATDGFRLSRKQLEVKQWTLDTDALILPARAISEIVRLLENTTSAELLFLPEAKQVVFVLDKTEIAARTLEGNFPQTEKIIPRDFSTEIVVDRKEFVSAVRSAGIFARDNNNIVRCSVSGHQLSVSATGGQMGESESVVEIEQKGEDLKIAFNYKFLLDFLGSVNSERIVVKANQPTTPAVFLLEEDQSLLHLIMPVRT